jgi:hypothetical protein
MFCIRRGIKFKLKFKRGWGRKAFSLSCLLPGFFVNVNVNVKVDGENLCELSVSAVKHQWMVEFFFYRRGAESAEGG